MDVAAPLRPENLRPFVSIVVPGAISLAPFTVLLGHYVPQVEAFWNDHPTAFSVIFAGLVLAMGFILAEVGERIEVHFWDRKLKSANANHEAEWHAYLRLALRDELVGQRFLRDKLTQFKFELSMSPALIVAWTGLLWIQLRIGIWSTAGFALFSVLPLGLAAYLVKESYDTAVALAETRRQILRACEEGPSGPCGGRS